MNILRTDALEWINRLYPRDWEDYYHKSEKVRAIKREMDRLADLLIKAEDTARHDTSYAGSVVGIKEALTKQQAKLIHAIDEEKGREREVAHREKLAELERKRIDLANEANRIAKRSQTIAITAVVFSLVVGIGAPLLNNYFQDKRDSRRIKDLEERIKNGVQDQLNPISEGLVDATNTAAEANRRTAQLEAEFQKIASQGKPGASKVKPKLKSKAAQ